MSNRFKNKVMSDLAALDEEKRRTIEDNAERLTGTVLNEGIWDQYGKYLGVLVQIQYRGHQSSGNNGLSIDDGVLSFAFLYRPLEDSEQIADTSNSCRPIEPMGVKGYEQWCEDQESHHKTLAAHYRAMITASPKPYPLPKRPGVDD